MLFVVGYLSSFVLVSAVTCVRSELMVRLCFSVFTLRKITKNIAVATTMTRTMVPTIAPTSAVSFADKYMVTVVRSVTTLPLYDEIVSSCNLMSAIC